MAATSVSGRSSISSVGTLPSGLIARYAGSRFCFLRNDSGRLSNGAPTSCSAMCGAIELEPGAKYSVSMVSSLSAKSAGARRRGDHVERIACPVRFALLEVTFDHCHLVGHMREAQHVASPRLGERV